MRRRFLKRAQRKAAGRVAGIGSAAAGRPPAGLGARSVGEPDCPTELARHLPFEVAG